MIDSSETEKRYADQLAELRLRADSLTTVVSQPGLLRFEQMRRAVESYTDLVVSVEASRKRILEAMNANQR